MRRRIGPLVRCWGRNGAGKSTLLRTVLGAVAPHGGRVPAEDRESTQRFGLGGQVREPDRTLSRTKKIFDFW